MNDYVELVLLAGAVLGFGVAFAGAWMMLGLGWAMVLGGAVIGSISFFELSWR